MNSKIKTLCIYYLVLYVIWAVCELVIRGAVIKLCAGRWGIVPDSV